MKKFILFIFSFFFLLQSYAKIDEEDFRMLKREIIIRSIYQNNNMQKEFCKENSFYCKTDDQEILIMYWILSEISIKQSKILIDLFRFNLTPVSEEMLKDFLVKNHHKIKYDFMINYEELNNQCIHEMNRILLAYTNSTSINGNLMNEQLKEQSLHPELLCRSIPEMQKIVNDLKDNKINLNHALLISKDQLLKMAYETFLLNNHRFINQENTNCELTVSTYKPCFITIEDWAILFIEIQKNPHQYWGEMIRFQLQTTGSEDYHQLIYDKKNIKKMKKIFRKLNLKKLRQQCEQEFLDLSNKYPYILTNYEPFYGCKTVEEMNNEIQYFLK